MKRRSFIKKSVAAAIVAATPLALTGLVNAEGGGSDTTDYFTDTTAVESTSIAQHCSSGSTIFRKVRVKKPVNYNGTSYSLWHCADEIICGGVLSRSEPVLCTDPGTMVTQAPCAQGVDGRIDITSTADRVAHENLPICIPDL